MQTMDMQTPVMAGPFSTDYLAEYVARESYDRLPGSVVHVAKRAILDSIGCAVGGTLVAPGRVVVGYVERLEGAAEATILGRNRRAPLPFAAYANAYLANVLDYDDTYTGAGHPGYTVVPAAVGAAERAGARGRDLLTAVVLGYEVSLRIGEAIDPTPLRAKRVRGQGTWQIFGATAPVARLLGLSPEQTASALALAGVHAPVPAMRKFGYQARPITPIKNNAGWACMGGVMAAQLAQLGLNGNLSLLDGEEGFATMASSDRSRPELLTAGLGTEYRIERLGFKPYTACRFIHTTLDALSALVERHELAAERVRSVTVRSTSKTRDYADYTPHGVVDAQFSIPYLAAMVLQRRPVGLSWLDEGNLRDPEVLAIGRRVGFETDPAAEGAYLRHQIISTVRVEATGGEVFEETVATPRGDPARPLSDDDLSAKFLSLTVPALGEARAAACLDRLWHLEQLDDARELTGRLRPE